jgi:DNA integrity scanning protein DisA with diadenylate cyclase activity
MEEILDKKMDHLDLLEIPEMIEVQDIQETIEVQEIMIEKIPR